MTGDLLSAIAPAVRGMLGAGAPEVVTAEDDFSGCGRFRFSLTYGWAPLPPLIVIGQNPSRASRRRTDPTVIRCARRAHRAGLGGLIMQNLFPFIATDPADLWAAGPFLAEEEGQRLDILATVRRNTDAPVLFAPGGDPHPRHRARAALIEAMVRGLGATLFCLGTTAAGLPRHPSRLGYDVPMVPWHGSFASAACPA